MKMEIVGCISTFEAEKTLGRTLESIRDLVDRVIIVDGSWEGFADYPASKDGTLAVAEAYDKPKTIIANVGAGGAAPYRNEMEKRNKYLDSELLHEGDWILYIDDDEYATQGMSQTRKFLEESTLTHHTAVVWRKTGEGQWSRTGEYVRCIRYVAGMKYGMHPWIVELPNGSSIPMTGILSPLHIAHDPSSKPKEYLEMKETAKASGNFGNAGKVRTVKRKRKTASSQPEVA